MNDQDPISELAYTDLMITCQIDGCANVFEASLREKPSDPVQDWADRMAKLARDAGWTAEDSGAVVCPTHARRGIV
jgi:RES domain-containing protein